MSSSPVRSPMCTSRLYVCPPNARCDIRRSGVRSKIPPQCSSSRTRSGASLACSSAICQLLRYLPPNIVSWKCMRQSSSGATFPSEAAIPPSAITVCALPSSDLHTSAVRAPASEAAIAARRPAPPAPITRTSYSCHDTAMSEEPRVVEDPRRGEPDVQVAEGDRAEADPRPLHVAAVEHGDAAPEPVPRASGGGAGEAVEPAPDEVAERVASEREEREQDDVGEQHQRPEAGPGMQRAVGAAEEESAHGVVPEERQHERGEVEEVAVGVLEDEREARLAVVAAAAPPGHRARRWGEEEGP